MLLSHTTMTATHATTLLHFLVSSYFSSLSSVLIVHNTTSSNDNALQQEYLHALQLSFRNQSHNGVIGMQWIDVAHLNRQEFDEQILRAVDIVTEGFITILSNTERFLHARYYATRNAELRLKDKFYLFLCDDENPTDFLENEILQFYPHHLMVIPSMPAANVTPEAEPKQTTEIIKTTLNKFPNATIGAPPLLPPCTATSYRDINFELWTQKFVGAADGNLEALLLDAFLPNETFAKNVELYPNKVSDLQGRVVRVGSITYIPYVVTNYVTAGTGNADSINSNGPDATVFYVGSEAEIVKSFCQVRKCHLRVEPYGVDNWGLINSENESSSGMMGDIYTQRVELAIGCIYNWYNNITETSHTIARSAVTLLGPAPAQFPAWRTNIMPFTNELWTFLISTMLLCSSVLYFIKLSTFNVENLKTGRQRKFKHIKAFEQAVLDIFAVFIQQPSAPTDLNRFAARFFLASLLCATITLENTYSGQLKSILTIPLYGERVDTMYKFSQTNWKWAAPSIVWVQTVEKSNLLKEQILTDKFEIRDYDFLYNASFRPDYGLGIERLLSGSFSFGDFITPAALETRIVPKDDLYFDWTRAVSIRGWPLMPLFNRHVRACMETGLFVHWERQSVAQYLDRQTQDMMLNLASGHASKMPPEKLTVENISGALFALLFGYVIAVMILLLEIFGHTLKLQILKIEKNVFASLKNK